VPTLKGYSNPDRVARHLGVTFTPAQLQEAEAAVAAAEAWIDRRTGRAWLTGAIASETHWTNGAQHIYLRAAPVASVTSVTARSSMYDTPDTELVVAEDYELRSLENGWVYLVGGTSYDRVTVEYTPAAPVPEDIALAATMLAAHWLQPQLSGMLPGIRSYSVGGELQVEFADAVATLGVPAEATALVDQYRRMAFA
jgi:hypothetical protein